jgi:hypothetical protein
MRKLPAVMDALGVLTAGTVIGTNAGSFERFQHPKCLRQMAFIGLSTSHRIFLKKIFQS